MSYLRGKTQKAKKFGTPTTPAVSTPKAPSPKAPKIVRTVAPTVTTAPKAVSKPTTTRRVLTQQEAGQIAEETFRTQVQSLTASLRNQRVDVKDYLSGSLHPATRQANVEKLARIDSEIAHIELEQHEAVLAVNINQIIQAIESGQVLAPDYFQNNIIWVKTGAITQQQFLDSYYSLSNQGIIHSAPTEPEVIEPVIEEVIEPVIEEIEVKETWWVIRPSGIIEQLTVTQKFVDTMTAQGWIFSKDKPTIEEPQNQNISIVFHIGKGGDLKTHFGINSIIVTPDEAEQLAKWLFEHYNTKIIFVMNRLTDDIRTHTLQQIKDLIVQKLKDDKPDSDDIDEDDIKKPQEVGFMGAGVAGAIAGLVLLGFIIDHKVSKR